MKESMTKKLMSFLKKNSFLIIFIINGVINFFMLLKNRMFFSLYFSLYFLVGYMWLLIKRNEKENNKKLKKILKNFENLLERI